MPRRGKPFRLMLLILIGFIPSVRGQTADHDGDDFFESKIRPVLTESCVDCHGPDKESGGLRLDSRDAIIRGGLSGPVINPGDPDDSLLVLAIRHEDEFLKMPPRQPKLAEQTIADFEMWVAQDPSGLASELGPTQSYPFAEEASAHWAFQPIAQVTPPLVGDASWSRTGLDDFILAKLEAQGWQPAPPASRWEWIRRVSFDLIGLPPTPEEIEAFVNDPAPDAFERVVDQFLNSPEYGERWAQHWLDVVRFAETEGYEYDRHIPDAWRFRDYVIDSLNRDKPFDQFLTEQLAGDEIRPDDPETLTAASFHRLGPVRRNAGNPEIALSRNEVLTERTDIIGTAFLGLTVGCARCHNHKLEPISQKDYYHLQAYMAGTQEADIVLASEQEQEEWDNATQQLRDEIQRLQKRAQKAQGEERARLRSEIEAMEARLPPPLPSIPSTRNDFERRTAIHVLRRGIWEQKGEAVGPRPLSVFVPEDRPELPADLSDPRTHLADWLTDADHPLTARVIANRLWQQHFGTGLVKSVNNFGLTGDPPSHPELLDWLSATLVENGWRLKPLHRLIVLSNTYRQSSRSSQSAEAEHLDPENRLLWRFPRRRLSAEEIRDAMLAVSGRLNPKGGGPSVMVPVAPDLVQLLYKPSQWEIAEDRSEFDRRSIYLIAKRNLRLPFLETFDAPPLLTSCAQRESSTHAPQALELLNGDLSNELAEAFARRLERATDGTPEQIVDQGFQLALGRLPTEAERALSLEFLDAQPLEEFALALFNLNGFLYVP